MKLLEAQPEIAPGAPPEPPDGTPPEEPAADPGTRTCKTCGATLEPGQDWCLACGTAAGRIGTRPGARAAMTIFGLTALLVAGAVGASYAALRENQTVPPSQAAAAQVAQAPPAATTAPPATTPPASTSTTPTTGTTTGKSSIPKVSVPSTASPAPVPITPSTPPATPSSPTPSVSPTPAPTPTPSASSPSGSSGGGGSTGGGGSQTSGGGSQTSTGGQTTTPAPAAPVAIDLGASAASVYDPYSRATAVGAPAKAIDGDASTSWFVDTAPGQTTVGAGLVVSLGSLRGTKAIDITTPTPGFKVEIYETDETTPPPAITDTRWAHITDKENVGEGGKTHIVLGGGSSKYATLLVWITKPPSDGTRVRIAELKVFG